MEKRPLEGQTFRVLGSASRFEFYPGPVVGGVAAKVSVPRLGCFLVVGAFGFDSLSTVRWGVSLDPHFYPGHTNNMQSTEHTL